MASLVDLSEDVLSEIALWLCPDLKESTPDWCFSQNSLWYDADEFHDLILLSETCRMLRRVLGRRIFSNASLVRFNEELSILRVPNSQTKEEEEHIMSLLHQLLALDTDSTFNNFIEYLEAPVSIVQNPLFGYQFPRLKALKVFATGDQCAKAVEIYATNDDAITPLINVEYLGTNALVIFNTPCLLASVGCLRRLDLLIDLSELTPETEIASIATALERHPGSLTELNLFMTSIEAFTHKEVLSLVAAAAPLLVKLTIRTVRRAHIFAPKAEWDVGSVTGREILQLINQKCDCLQLLTVGDEMFTCFQFVLPGLQYCRKRPLHLTYVRRPPTSFAFQGQDNLVAFTVGVGATAFHLLYFETELLRHHNQIDLLLVLLSMVSLEYSYQKIQLVSVENCWSYENDGIMRAKFENKTDFINASGDQKRQMRRQLAAVHPWTRLPLNTPYHKQKEEYNVSYYAKGLEQYSELLAQLWRLTQGFTAMILASSNAPLPQLHPVSDTAEMDECRRHFWGLETALLELEQYCLREKKRSSLWD